MQAALEQAEAGIKQAEASLENARINLDRTKVRAPFRGLASKATASVGELISASRSLPCLPSTPSGWIFP